MRGAIATLRAFAGTAPAARARCDFCGGELDERHAHVLDAARHAARCACPRCAALARASAANGIRALHGKARRVETAALRSPQWDALGIPVGLAWFYRSADGAVHARYPGAAGPVASRDDTPQWREVTGSHALLATLEPDVEALLVRRTPAHTQAWRVSIDRCWHLAGLLRRHWHGADGGPALRAQLESFFAELDDGRA